MSTRDGENASDMSESWFSVGILLVICSKLYEDGVLPQDCFILWEQCNDPAELEGKGALDACRILKLDRDAVLSQQYLASLLVSFETETSAVKFH